MPSYSRPVPPARAVGDPAPAQDYNALRLVLLELRESLPLTGTEVDARINAAINALPAVATTGLYSDLIGVPAGAETTTQLPAPGAAVVAANTSRQVTVSCAAYPRASAYRVYREGTTGPVGAESVPSWTSGALANGTYRYSICAVVDGAETRRADVGSIIVDGTARSTADGNAALTLAAPSGFVVTAAADRTVTVSVNAYPSASSYRVYEASSSGVVAEVTVPTRTSGVLTARSTYTYSMTVVVNGVESPRTAALTIAVDGTARSSADGTATGGLTRLAVASSGQVTRGGGTWRAGGANVFQLALNDYPSVHLTSHDDIDALLDKAKALNLGIVRAHTLGINVGSHIGALVTGVTGTGVAPTITYNDAAWETIDYAIKAAGDRNIYLMIPMTDEVGAYHGSKRTWVNFRRPGTCSTVLAGQTGYKSSANDTAERAAERYFYTDTQIKNDFKKYLSDWLTRTNRYTGKVQGTDPTLAVVELGNELWTTQDVPTWAPEMAAHVRSLAPDVIIADGAAADGQELITEHLNSADLKLFGAHPYTTFGATDVTRMAQAAAARGKAFHVGEYGWSKTSAPDVEAAARASTNTFFTAFWSLQLDKDLHNGGGTNTYGTDDASLYVPGKTQVERDANARLINHANAMQTGSTAPASGGTSDTDFNSDFPQVGALPAARFAVTATTGSSAQAYGGYAQLKTGAQGNYLDRVTVESLISSAADRFITFDTTPQTPGESYLSVALRAASGGANLGGSTRYNLEINSDMYASIFKQVGATKTVIGAGKVIPGGAIGTLLHVEFSVKGTALTARVWTGNTRPTAATFALTDASITAIGQCAILLNGGAAGAARQWDIGAFRIGTPA